MKWSPLGRNTHEIYINQYNYTDYSKNAKYLRKTLSEIPYSEYTGKSLGASYLPVKQKVKKILQGQCGRWSQTWPSLLGISRVPFSVLNDLRPANSRGRIPGRNWDKSLKSFPPCYSQSPPLTDFTPTSPLSKSGLKRVSNINIVYGNLISEDFLDYAQKRNCLFMNSASGWVLTYHQSRSSSPLGI